MNAPDTTLPSMLPMSPKKELSRVLAGDVRTGAVMKAATAGRPSSNMPVLIPLSDGIIGVCTGASVIFVNEIRK